METDHGEAEVRGRELCHPSSQNGVFPSCATLQEANVVGIEQVLHGLSLGSSEGRSAWRRVLPCSRASRNADSSEMEPVTFSSQLLVPGALPRRFCRSAMARSTAVKRHSRATSSNMAPSMNRGV